MRGTSATLPTHTVGINRCVLCLLMHGPIARGGARWQRSVVVARLERGAQGQHALGRSPAQPYVPGSAAPSIGWLLRTCEPNTATARGPAGTRDGAGRRQLPNDVSADAIVADDHGAGRSAEEDLFGNPPLTTIGYIAAAASYWSDARSVCVTGRARSVRGGRGGNCSSVPLEIPPILRRCVDVIERSGTAGRTLSGGTACAAAYGRAKTGVSCWRLRHRPGCGQAVHCHRCHERGQGAPGALVGR